MYSCLLYAVSYKFNEIYAKSYMGIRQNKPPQTWGQCGKIATNDYICRATVVESAGNETRSRAVLFWTAGDAVHFGRHTTEDMKKRLGVKDSRPLADFLPTLTIAAKNLATEITNYNVEGKNLFGESAITREHMQNNQSVREMLGKRGIRPEELPPEEDIKKLERRVASEEKKIEKTSSKLPKKK